MNALDLAPDRTRGVGVTLEGGFRHGGTILFDRLRLRLEPARWTCLLGPSGVGKTTILRLLAGLDPGGSFDGRLAAADGGPLAGRVAYMAQADLLAPWLDVRGNVMLGARLRGERPDRARAERVIARVGLAEHAAKRPRELSGGMRQRAALARALMEDRAVMLLDEPFSALDARTRAEMQELAFETLAGRTVLLVTHEPAEAARLGARILLMDRGGLAELPTPPGPPIRAADAPETLAAQAELLRRLRGGAA